MVDVFKKAKSASINDSSFDSYWNIINENKIPSSLNRPTGYYRIPEVRRSHDNNNYYITFDLSSIRSIEDLNINLLENMIILKAILPYNKTKTKDKNFDCIKHYRKEIRIPFEIDYDKFDENAKKCKTASMYNGIVDIIIPIRL